MFDLNYRSQAEDAYELLGSVEFQEMLAEAADYWAEADEEEVVA